MGDFAGMNQERDFRVVFVGKNKPIGIDTLRFGEKVHYTGVLQTVKLVITK
jgi:hypothetical protein